MSVQTEQFTLPPNRATKGNQAVILVVVRNQGNRRLIRDQLSEEYDVRTPEGPIGDETFDLCLLDAPSMRANQDLLLRLKTETAPVFLPLLLLSEDKRSARSNPAILQFADDVVYIPISPSVLQSRIQLLLRTRRYSLKLENRNQQLEQKNEQLRIFEQAINSTNAGIIITDATEKDNPIIFCNEGFEDLTGYSSEEIQGQNCRFLQNDDTNQAALDQIRAAINREKQGEARLRNYRKDGSLFWNDLKISPIKSKEGEITHFVGVQHDVTELIQTQELLEEQKEQYKLLAENSTDMISRHAADGTYLYASPASEYLTGYAPADLLAESVYDFIHPDDRDRVKQCFISSFEKTGSSNTVIESVRYRLRTNHRGYRWVETTSKTIWGAYSKKVIEIQASTRDITERIEYQQKLEKERNLFRKLTQSSPVGIMIIDPDGKLSFANNRAEHILGRTKSEMIGLAFSDPQWEISDLEGDPLPEEQLFFHRVYHSGDPVYDVQHAIEWPNSERKLLSINAVPLFDNQNTIEGVIATIIDITERKEQEQKLQEEQKFVRTAIENQPGIFFMVNEQMNFTLWNNAMETELGYSAEEIEQMHPLEFFREEDRSKVKSKIEKILSSGKADLEAQIISKKGTPIHYYLIGSRLDREEGTFIIGSAVDIDKRVKTEQKLRESEQRWEELVRKNPSLIQITDKDGTIRYVNPAGAKLYGFEDSSKLIGKPFLDFIEFKHEELMQKRMSMLLQTEKELPPATYSITAKEGKERIIELQSLSLKQEEERVILTIGKDVTEQYRYEEKLEQSLEEKKVLLQEIHHRVKNNLAIISGLLGLQQEEIEDPVAQKALQNSNLRIHSIAKVHELLYQHEELNKIDFRQYILELTRTMEHMNKKEQLEVAYQYDMEELFLNIDQAIPCGMVVNELITNSIKHAFRDLQQGTIFISLSQTAQTVQLQISDNGIGLPDSFSLANVETLGTTIIDLLIKQLNAKIDYYNNKKAGSTFELTFEKRGYSGPAKKI